MEIKRHTHDLPIHRTTDANGQPLHITEQSAFTGGIVQQTILDKLRRSGIGDQFDYSQPETIKHTTNT